MDGNGKETKQKTEQEKKKAIKQGAEKGIKAASGQIKQKDKKKTGGEKANRASGVKKKPPKAGKAADVKKMPKKKTTEFPKEKKAAKGKKKTGEERNTKEKSAKEIKAKEIKTKEISTEERNTKEKSIKGKGSGEGKKKPRNPNLKLVKNGDLPVKEKGMTEKKKKETGKEEKQEKKSEEKTGKAPEKEQEKKPGKKIYPKPKSKEAGGIYQDGPGIGEWFAQHKSLIIIGLTCCAFISIIFGIYHYIVTAYEVTTVYVDGNIHYTNEEIMDMVMGGRYGNNSLYLSMKYKDKGIEGIPFVEKMDVHILTPNTIRISVYEKALAGYVEYLGRYMYFDRDGTVVESSESRTSGIPQVTGLKFDYVVLNELLPVENDEIFKRILDITQLLNKYEIMADKIFFDSSYDLTLFFGDVRVTLGSNSGIDQKIIRLKNILPELEGKKGTLQMDNYTEDKKNITFHQE